MECELVWAEHESEDTGPSEYNQHAHAQLNERVHKVQSIKALIDPLGPPTPGYAVINMLDLMERELVCLGPRALP